MKISVIIVNYNVRAYLEQCLRTVYKALEGVEGDVFVVDNLSTDGSVEMVREKFPQVRLIANQDNVGFSRANNQAIRESTAEYVVLLNPDTVVGEDVFRKVIAFLDTHPKAGGLGVKMIDGTGHFLPESKRGLPTPSVAFFKIIGLTRLFPRSTVFGRYHLGHLEEDQVAPIEILSGACMFLRRRTLDQVGLLDENFFMYGEDIDLSYRITLGGYENWYFPDARIIHYKGESTKKSSVNYVFVFYNAMAIFAKKHFTRKRPDLFAGLINASIYLSAAGAIVARFLNRALVTLLDVGLLFVGLALLFDGPMRDRLGIEWLVIVLGWCVVAVGSLGLCGGYDRPVRLVNVVKGAALSLPSIMIMDRWRGYGDVEGPLLPFIALVLVLAPVLVRVSLHLLRLRTYRLRQNDRRRVLALGSREEGRHALALLWQTHFGLGQQEVMSIGNDDPSDASRKVRRVIRRRGIDEVVFCAKDLEWQRIIALMEGLKRSRVEFKIMQPGREFIIGTSSIESLHDLHIMERHAVNSAAGRRTKRIVDVGVALALLTTLPLLIWFVQHKTAFLSNWWNVLIGRMSWVGYHPARSAALKLPALKPGVVDPVIVARIEPLPLTVDRVNITYAKDYRPWGDVQMVLSGFARLGG